ncbi:MAG: hypothetical protein E7164_04590 [Firmicutes bacterium]|nr:hypothetical protein [Bacillota bacterium]
MKKYIIAIVLGLIGLGIVIGLNNHVDLSNVVKITFTYRFLLKMFLIILCGIALAFAGIPFFIFVLILELISFGIVTTYLAMAFSFGGIAFSILYFLIFKMVYCFLLSLISFYALKLTKNNYLYIFKRFHEYKNNRRLYLKKMLIISVFILLFSLLVTTLGNKVLLPLSKFLLKIV